MAERYKDGDNIDLWLMKQTRPIETDFALYLEEKERKAKAELKEKRKKTSKVYEEPADFFSDELQEKYRIGKYYEPETKESNGESDK